MTELAYPLPTPHCFGFKTLVAKLIVKYSAVFTNC